MCSSDLLNALQIAEIAEVNHNTANHYLAAFREISRLLPMLPLILKPLSQEDKNGKGFKAIAEQSAADFFLFLHAEP